jgi:hypothetical protein
MLVLIPTREVARPPIASSRIALDRRSTLPSGESPAEIILRKIPQNPSTLESTVCADVLRHMHLRAMSRFAPQILLQFA